MHFQSCYISLQNCFKFCYNYIKNNQLKILTGFFSLLFLKTILWCIGLVYSYSNSNFIFQKYLGLLKLIPITYNTCTWQDNTHTQSHYYWVIFKSPLYLGWIGFIKHIDNNIVNNLPLFDEGNPMCVDLLHIKPARSSSKEKLVKDTLNWSGYKFLVKFRNFSSFWYLSILLTLFKFSCSNHSNPRNLGMMIIFRLNSWR